MIGELRRIKKGASVTSDVPTVPGILSEPK
jgi:hypothetical protein